MLGLLHLPFPRGQSNGRRGHCQCSLCSPEQVATRDGVLEQEMVDPRLQGGVRQGLGVYAQLDHSEMFTELYREEKKEAGDRGGQKWGPKS